MNNIALSSVDLLRSDGTPIPGLIKLHDHNLPTNAICIDERAAIFDAESFRIVDYVLFRRFSDSRSSQVAAYVVDNTRNQHSEESLSTLHSKVWLHGSVPLLYVAWPGRIDVLTCARGADFWQAEEYQYHPARILETTKTIHEELQRFSAFRLMDGTFWEDPINHKLADYTKAAHSSLIQAVVDADRDLQGSENPTLRRLLLLMVLVKYLEDRRVFPEPAWFGQWHKGATSFFEVLQGGNPDEVLALLGFLEKKFNGDIFKLPLQGNQTLTQENLEIFSRLVEARTINQQRYLWKQFSFEHLPVEIISHLYQRFVQGEGAVYTPPFQASLLLDQVMPYTTLSGQERILDPAFGSGVFLVGAFQRLINIWRNQNDWKKPGVETLKQILLQSIYGIELDTSAIDLAAFSLNLAICDALGPEAIWDDLRFDRLRDTNLLEADFFAEVLKLQKKEASILANGFDIVIGNPPFASKLTMAGMEVDHSANQKEPNRGLTPDKQTAYLFLEQALEVLRPHGQACLLQPSGFLYNHQSKSFRDHIFCKYQAETILDFTSIRKLYDKADTKTVAVLATAREPSPEHWVSHWTFRRTTTVRERICFELDHYDRHNVLQSSIPENPLVWRTNLLGGGRLGEFSQRFQSSRTLGEFIEQQGWLFNEGFKIGNRAKEALYLTDKPFLPTDALTQQGINDSQISIVKETHFERARQEELYQAPLVLIREHTSLPSAFLDEGEIAYKANIVGIHANELERASLLNFYNTFRRRLRLYQLFCALHSSQVLVGKATAILKNDIEMLPYPEDPAELEFTYWEEVLQDDVLDYMTEYVRLGQKSRLLKEAASPETLQEYSNLFVRMLGTIYDNLRAAQPVFLDGLIGQPFYFGERPEVSWLTEEAAEPLHELIYQEDLHAHLRTIRILRFYSENVLLLVKPDRLRYWIPSTAIRDADETLVDLSQQGY